LGVAELATDPRFRRNVDRISNRPALVAALGAALKDSDGRAVADRLLRLGVPSAPVLGVADATRAPHTSHRHMVVEEDGYKGSGFPAKFSRTPATLRRRPPRKGEHTQDVLREAGLDDARYSEMLAQGAFGRLAQT
jgi:crotonobetainyl-CoA:carnitine CoA-transferase CaiB-like acyl-CoA transferase